MNIQFLSKKITFTSRAIFLGIYLGAVSLYVLIRTFTVSVVHDEAITYFISLKNLSSIFSFEALTGFAANNHLLNTILIKFFEAIFGDYLLILRLPALLGFFLYLIFSVKISKLLFPKRWIVWPVMVLTLNPFVLDFFSLARGYSLALGLLMGCVYFFLKSFEKKSSPTELFKLIGCGILASLANFSFLIPFFSIFFIKICFSVVATFKEKKIQSKSLILKNIVIPALATPALLYALVGPQLLFLKKTGELYAGGNTGFFSDTIMSLINSSLYNQDYTLSASILVVVMMVLLLSLGIKLIIDAYQNKNFTNLKHLVYVFLVIVVLCIGIELQHILFNTPFVTDRTAIYFIPLVMLLLLLIFYKVLEYTNEKHLLFIRATGITLVIFLLSHSVSAGNFSSSYVWEYDSDTKDILQDVSLIHQASPQTKLAVWNNWKLEPSINYMKQTDGLDWLNWSYRTPATEMYNVYILLPEDYYLLKTYSLQIIKQYTISGAILAIKTTSIPQTQNNLSH